MDKQSKLNINAKRIEVFCGTGGVGKTTISTSRALHLASRGKSVLLITIDPARRLKQVLGLNDSQLGVSTNIDIKKLGIDSGNLDALLLCPAKTLQRTIGKEIDNHILKTLSKPYGGLNEIMAVLEVQYQLKQKSYDVIILDTPPGKHFIDFLNATQKIHSFFDKNFAEIFNFIGKKNKPGRILSKIVSSGVEKLLSYLEKVTGKGFVKEFIEAIHVLYEHRAIFIEGLNLEKDLMDVSTSNWFLVTSADQLKGRDAKELLEASKSFMHKDNYLVVNKSWHAELEKWEVSDDSHNELRDKLLAQEKDIKNSITKYNVEIIEFPEVFSNSPMEQVNSLRKGWQELEVTL